MSNKLIVPAIALLATLVAGAYAVVRLEGQSADLTGDFTRAAAAEVRDASGQVVLRGQFVLEEEPDDEDVERRAALEPTGVDADAAGEAEVEYAVDAPVDQEIEFSVRNVAPGSELTFVIDGIEVAKATSDSRGRAEVELDVKLSGPVASR